MELTATNDEAALCSVQLAVGNVDNFIFQTHPKINKQLYDKSGLLQLKDTTKGYSLTHSLTHSLNHSLTHSLTYRSLHFSVFILQAPEDFFSSARNGNISGVKRRLDDGVRADSQDDKYGDTALIDASYNGHKAVCELLITRGCNVDMQSNVGNTALMEASMNGQKAICELLIEAGCDYSLRNKEGKSAMDYLREKHPDKVKEVQVSRSPTAVVTHSLI